MFEMLSKSQKKHGGRSWCLNHRSRGDAPVTCMGIIIATIVLGILAYRFFWRDRALERACDGLDINENKRADTAAINTYRLRARDKYIPMIDHMNQRYRKVCLQVYKGKIDKAAFDDDYLHLDEDIRQTIDDINEVIVPSKFVPMHRNMAVTLGRDWKALCLAKEAIEAAEEPVKKQKIAESKQELSKANKACEAAKMSAKEMFKQ